VLDLDPSQNYSGTVFVVTSDGSGGVDVTNVANPFVISVTSGHPLTITSAPPAAPPSIPASSAAARWC
jgi:hypothetical protein